MSKITETENEKYLLYWHGQLLVFQILSENAKEYKVAQFYVSRAPHSDKLITGKGSKRTISKSFFYKEPTVLFSSKEVLSRVEKIQEYLKEYRKAHEAYISMKASMEIEINKILNPPEFYHSPEFEKVEKDELD